ncbi:MAG: alpha/beta fold hydrolase, partial [Roseiflexaceae bacterium]|nr:alpha/beta fold hydrolase [Roseiflexaceae bacterium]
MPTHKLTFKNAAGLALAARLELPDHTPPRAYAVFAHCFTCTKNVKAIVEISRALAASGLGVLRFDFTGLGESAGEFVGTTFASNADDLVAAAGFLATQYAAPQLLIGHSLGGAAVLLAAQRTPSVTAVATINAPCSPAHLVDLLGEARDQIAASGQATVQLGGAPVTISR